MATTVPRLRHEALVRPFDDRGAQPRFIIAVDGCHFIVTPMVAAVLDETRQLRAGDDDMETLARRVATRLGRPVAGTELERLLMHRVPKALIEGGSPTPGGAGPIVMRRTLMTGPSLARVLGPAGRLFATGPAVVTCSLLVIVHAACAVQIWKGGAVEAALSELLWGIALTLAGVLAHELGHLAACRRFGGSHGGIGIGIYWFMPAFHAEVHGAWMLPRRQRAVVDMAGVYFQSLFLAVPAAVHLAFPSPALAIAIAWSHFLMLHTLNPVLKFDGYWLLCDLAGVHNLHRDISAIARRAIGGRWPSPAEFALLLVFMCIAAGYFWYVLALLGRNLGVAAASLAAALTQPAHSASTLVSMAGNGLMLALLCAMSVGVSLLLARAAGAIATADQGSRR